MRSNYLKATLKTAALAVTVLLLGAGVSFAQTVNLTAGSTSITLPDGQNVSMWGYTCTSTPVAPATCTASNPNAGTGWSPVVITVPPGNLTINLTNSLPGTVPTSLVIVGQLGGGLGTPTSVASPIHAIQGATWPIAGDTSGAKFTPPAQGPRVQSFGTELAHAATAALSWNNLKAGTYLIESGTHPSIQGPMGLYGILVVTTAPTNAVPATPGNPNTIPPTPPTPAIPAAPGLAYAGVSYDADVPLLLSEIDAAQNAAVAAAVAIPGFSETSIRVLRDSVSSVTVALDSTGAPIGGTGYHVGDVVTISGGGAPAATAGTAKVSSVNPPTGGAITGVTVVSGGAGYTSVPLANASGGTGGIGAQLVVALSLAGVMCSDGAGACYPPAVNYDPRYYLVNGVAFDRTGTNANRSLFATTLANATGTVLVRFVNAGLRMHVPSIVGALTNDSSSGTLKVVPGFSLVAEDGNVLPGNPRVQSEVFLAAGKTYDVLMNAPQAVAPAAAPSALPVFDRQLSLSNNNQRDGGMQAYIGVNGATLTTSGAGSIGLTAAAKPDSYFLVPGNALTVSDPAKGVIANDIGVYGVQLLSGPTSPCTPSSALPCVTLNPDGTFVYVPAAGATAGSFTYCANGTVTGSVCSTGSTLTATVTLAACTAGSGCLGEPPVANADSYTSNIASRLQISPPGVLANDTDPQGHPLCSAPIAVTGCPTTGQTFTATGGTVTLNPDGSFTAVPTTAPVGTSTATVSFQYKAVNSQKTASAPATVTVTFNGGSNLQVHVYDAPSFTAATAAVPITDYRWIIEEDRTFQIDPKCQVNSTPRPAGCPALPAPSLGTNFHTSYMPVVAAGCVGTAACESGQTVFDPKSMAHLPAVCDVGNGDCRTSATQQAPVNPSQVHLDPTKHYYISILPGDAGNSFTAGAGAPQPKDPAKPTGPQRQFSIALDCPSGPGGADFAPGTGACGHGMGGAPIGPAQTVVNVLLQETPLATAKIAVFVFEDDNPLNGENDSVVGLNPSNPIEPGLGGFEITLFDAAGGTGDSTGQMTYDMFNMPLSNSLAGTPDPAHPGNDACPITKNPDGLVGMIVTCPHFESDGVTISPLEGQAVIANMMPGRYGVVATPAADRIARGEEWLQTNTLDGQKAHESFIRVGGPAYFQEFGPAGFHVSIGFANPKIISNRLAGVCKGLVTLANPTPCTFSVTGRITDMHQSRTPDQRLYGSGSRDALGFTQCFVSLGNDEIDFAFAKCDGDGRFTVTGLPPGDWRITIFDQWNDQIVDGLSTAVHLPGTTNGDIGDIPVQQWHTNIYTSTFFDTNKDGVRAATEKGLSLVPTNIRFRDGSYSNFNNTDLNGFAGFNEIFPLFSWYVIEADTTRYKQTGVHVVYDAGGAVDCTTPAGATAPPCSTIAGNFANTAETVPLPTNLRVPGAVYCGNADCNGFSILNGPSSSAANPSTGRIDPPWVTTEGLQGFIGSSEFIEFGKAPFATGENGGIKGEVIYASTRPFDDPALLIHTSWTPDVPNVTINLYQEGTAADGTQSLTLVDTTKTSSWDDWAQGFRSNGVPNMNCPGQLPGTGTPSDLYFFTLAGSTQFLNPGTTLPSNSQFKCYDGLHNFNQVQPAPYDGMYKFPSVTATDPTTGKPIITTTNGKYDGSNCSVSVCKPNPTGDGTLMLAAGKYVVEMIVPPGYELVKEEDKNILIGDNYIAPVTQQFGGLGSIFILPDQAAVNSQFNPNNPLNPTQNLGSSPRHEGDTGSVESFWPCVGALRIVPDYISLFPYSAEVSPFAGASRHLCDRKEVTLEDQMSALAKFWVFSSTHVAAHFTGFILDDMSSEFDPFSPQFGEKFAVPNLPVSIKDFGGNEILRTYSDQWGQYNGLNYSTWEVNPPNPTGYAPTMMVTCMNDPGPIPDPAHPGQTMIDPLYNPAYSQFCYEIPYMPGQTQYMDTPVVPTAAFAEGYNPVDCAYPDATPAIASVIGHDATNAVAGSSDTGPWVSGPSTDGSNNHTMTITALGDQQVPNPAYAGPQATTAPFNQKFLARHYGFGNTRGTGSVMIGGVNAPVVSWSDAQIVVRVPNLTAAQSSCNIQQTTATTTARCGELVITSGNGKQSIDTVTVTIGGKPPTYISGENSESNALQIAIDNATPGDLIIVGPGTYNEMLLMWKPVRLQGVGAASVKVNANTHPSGKMDVWRRQVNCLFGLALNGGFIGAQNPFDPNGTFTCSPTMYNHVDPLPLEAIIGWDATQNGNLAELLQEPTLMGAYEGAGITVLAKGLKNVTFGVEGITGDRLTNIGTDCTNYPSNFLCNPSRIDGLSFANSSQGGGGIFLHGWNHNMEVSNNRVFANAGTLTGGITVGQLENPVVTVVGTQQSAYGFNIDVKVHNNSVTQNASIGGELTATSASGAGGVTFCTGSDSYRFNYNWVCGNLSLVNGGGFGHLGFSYNGDISHNWFLFNQSNNPSIPTHGGGVIIQGATEGAGPHLVIDSNLIQGNTAENGSGGGLRLQNINGSEVGLNPGNSGQWYGVTITNNIIANNVAGWDGGGVSLQDALLVKFTNNTVIGNDTTASAGGLSNGSNATPRQVAGLVTTKNTPNLFSSTVACPAAYYPNGNCATVSLPLLENNLFWQNRSFNISVGGLGTGPKNQQNLVTLVPMLNQTATGACPNTTNYWDIGIRGDTTPTPNSGSGFALNPTYSILTDPTFYPNAHNLGSDPAVVRQYCNGSRVPPEAPGLSAFGYEVPPGITDAIVPNPLFNLTAAATVDEGNNWINMAYGPLSLTNEAAMLGTLGYNQLLGNFRLTSASPAIGQIPSGTTNYVDAPNVDFFGTPRKTNPDPRVDIGAVEYLAVSAFVLDPASLTFSSSLNVTTGPQTVTVNNTGDVPLTLAITITGLNNGQFSQTSTGCAPVASGGSCTIDVRFTPTGTSMNPRTATLSVAAGGTTLTVSLTGNIFVLVPTLPVLDNFNRANASTLGANWSQMTTASSSVCTVLGLGTAPCAFIQVNTNQASDLTMSGFAFWNGAGNVFGAKQGAAFTFVNTTVNGSWLMLKASGGTAAFPANYIRVLYNNGAVAVSTTTNGNSFPASYTTRGTFPVAFTSGDVLTAQADATGTVSVWKTTGATTTFVGQVAIPTSGTGAWTQGTGGGRMGLLLPVGGRVDNFAGGTVVP